MFRIHAFVTNQMLDRYTFLMSSHGVLRWYSAANGAWATGSRVVIAIPGDETPEAFIQLYPGLEPGGLGQIVGVGTGVEHVARLQGQQLDYGFLTEVFSIRAR